MNRTSDDSGGVYAAALTPLSDGLAPDHRALAAHCRWLLENGCHGLAVLGTTGEANSFSAGERIEIMEQLVEAGIPGDRLLPGTGCCAVPDTVRLSRRAVELGAAGVLMLPPFYYKNTGDDGLFAAFSEAIEGVGDSRLRVYLYHFPQMSNVPISHRLIERLLARYPDTVAGIKDSSGELDNMTSMVREFPGFAVLSGWDHLLLPLLEAGGAGCITAVCNVACGLAREVFDGWRSGNAGDAHRRLSAVRKAIAAYPLTAALKEIMARHTGDDGWRRLRAPLTPLDAAGAEALIDALAATGFTPPPV